MLRDRGFPVGVGSADEPETAATSAAAACRRWWVQDVLKAMSPGFERCSMLFEEPRWISTTAVVTVCHPAFTVVEHCLANITVDDLTVEVALHLLQLNSARPTQVVCAIVAIVITLLKASDDLAESREA